MDPVKILKRAWHILWHYRTLWVFGLILAMAAGSSSGNSGNNSRYEANHPSQATPQSMQQAFRDAQHEVSRLFENGIPEINATGDALVKFMWVVGAFVLVMMIVGVIMTIARFVSENAVIRMVDEYETSGEKMTVRQGFRIGWSKTAWHLFLIDLIVNLPAIILTIILLVIGFSVLFAVGKGTVDFAAFGVVSTIVLAFISIFVVVILTIVLHLFRNFFWRVSVLENVGVRESFRRGYALVIENWKNVGLMWIVMVGIGIVWAVASVILIVVTIPLVIITGVIALIVASVPFLLFAGIFNIFLSGWLPWIAGGLFVAPLFFTIAFSPWLLISSWQAVYTSTVWTLTYREIKALPNGREIEVAELPAAS